MKTLAVFVALAATAAFGVKSQRYGDIEMDQDAHSKIDVVIRQTAADFNPKVSLTQRELKDFEVLSLKVTRPRVMTFLDSVAGGDQNYEVYVRYYEGGAQKCATLELKRSHADDSWSASHPGGFDRCDPVW